MVGEKGELARGERIDEEKNRGIETVRRQAEREQLGRKQRAKVREAGGLCPPRLSPSLPPSLFRFALSLLIFPFSHNLRSFVPPLPSLTFLASPPSLLSLAGCLLGKKRREYRVRRLVFQGTGREGTRDEGINDEGANSQEIFVLLICFLQAISH